MNKDNDTLNVIIPGLVALVLLMILLGVPGFVEWFKERTVLYVIWFFFSAPIARILINRKVDSTSALVVGVGVAVLLPYCFLAGLTLFDVVRSLLEVVIVLSLFFTVFSLFKQKLLV